MWAASERMDRKKAKLADPQADSPKALASFICSSNTGKAKILRLVTIHSVSLA